MGRPRRSGARADGRVRCARLLLLFLPLVLLLPGRSPAADGVAGRWTVVRGSVAVTKAGAGGPHAAHPGEALAVGDLFETADGARAQALLADDTVVNLSSETSLRFLHYAFDRASGRRTAVVKVLRGKARFIVSARKNSRFTVESPHAAVAATAADFVTLVAPDATTVAALEGTVTVRNISNLVVADVELWSNQTSVVQRGTVPSHPAAIAPQRRREYRRDARDF